MKKGQLVALLILLVLLVDQASKFYIKLHFHYNQDVPIFGLEWAKLHFVENEGMAFGITFGWDYGKLALSVFRIILVGGLIWYLRALLNMKAPMGFVYCIGLITAGALGNIIHEDITAQLVGFGNGYASEMPLGGFLYGKVVDMLYFPITYIPVPEAIPYIGGERYLFFSPIFNVADAAITCGVLAIVFFQRRFFKDAMLTEEQAAAEKNEVQALQEQIDAAENSETAHMDTPADEMPAQEPPAAQGNSEAGHQPSSSGNHADNEPNSNASAS
jgi:signal peptidase II